MLNQSLIILGEINLELQKFIENNGLEISNFASLDDAIEKLNYLKKDQKIIQEKSTFLSPKEDVSYLKHEVRNALTLFRFIMDKIKIQLDPNDFSQLDQVYSLLLKLVAQSSEIELITHSNLQAWIDPFQDIFKSKKLFFKSSINVQDFFTYEVEFKKIILNLIQNAYRYTDFGGVFLDITSYLDHIEIKIKDSGVGMTDLEISQVRSKEQTEISKTRKGSGLGFSIINRDLDKLGGQLVIDSLPGLGTTFFIHIPVFRSNPFFLKNKSIYILEDDLDLQNWLDIKFREMGAKAVLFGQGKTCLADISHGFDIFLCDYYVEDRPKMIDIKKNLTASTFFSFLTGAEIQVPDPEVSVLQKPLDVKKFEYEWLKFSKRQESYVKPLRK